MAISEQPSNAGQAAEWDGPAGDHRIKHADLLDASSAGFSRRLLEVADVRATDRVLDLGCGTGASTRIAARAAVSGAAHGVDLSARMLELAQKRSAEEGLDNITFQQADAQVHPFRAAGFDLAISQFGTMFFADPVAAFTNIGRALRPAGRLVMLVWQDRHHQEWSMAIRRSLAPDGTPPSPIAASPFSLAEPDTVRGILRAAGYDRVQFTDVRESVNYGPDVATVCEVMLGLRSVKDLLAPLGPAETELAVDRLRATLADHLTGDGVRFGTRTWIISAIRVG
jgi:SAM-dependent methyltransferase